MKELHNDEYDSQVVDAEPELAEFDVSDVDAVVREDLADELENEFSFDITTEVTNWDRNLSYPRSGVDYSYHLNLYRQLISDSDTLTLSWIQAMDLAYVAEEVGQSNIRDRLESFSKQFNMDA